MWKIDTFYFHKTDTKNKNVNIKLEQNKNRDHKIGTKFLSVHLMTVQCAPFS